MIAGSRLVRPARLLAVRWRWFSRSRWITGKIASLRLCDLLPCRTPEGQQPSLGQRARTQASRYMCWCPGWRHPDIAFFLRSA